MFNFILSSNVINTKWSFECWFRQRSSLPIMTGVPSERKWLDSSLPLEASSEPWLQSKSAQWVKFWWIHTSHTRCSFIQQPTLQTWSWRSPQATGSGHSGPRLSRSTAGIPQKMALCLRHPPEPLWERPPRRQKESWANIGIALSLPRTQQYLLDLPVCGDRSLHVALLLEPGTDGLKGSVSAAPAVVVNVVLHVVVVTVDASNQGHLEKTHLCVWSKQLIGP